MVTFFKGGAFKVTATPAIHGLLLRAFDQAFKSLNQLLCFVNPIATRCVLVCVFVCFFPYISVLILRDLTCSTCSCFRLPRFATTWCLPFLWLEPPRHSIWAPGVYEILLSNYEYFKYQWAELTVGANNCNENYLVAKVFSQGKCIALEYSRVERGTGTQISEARIVLLIAVIVIARRI